MKYLSLLLSAFVISYSSYAQCGKDAVLRFEKISVLKNGTEIMQQEMGGSISLHNEKIKLNVSLAGQEDVIEGEITEVIACEWKSFLKNGKAIYKAMLKKENESARLTLVEIVTNKDKVIITFSEPDKSTGMQFEISEFIIEN